MRRNWHIGPLESFWRRGAKNGKRGAELDRAKNPRRENQGSEELKETWLVSPPSARKEERTDTSGREKKTPGMTGKRRLCIICGKSSDEMICGACADKIGADAVEKKRWEEKGKP